MISCSKAPVRADPSGGGTDAPPFRIEHGGAVVNFAVNHHVFASAQRLAKGQGVIIWSMDLHQGTVTDSVGDLARDSHLEFVKAFVFRLVSRDESLLLLTDSDVHPGSGLGGSGALGVAIVKALDHAWGRQRSAPETAALANDIERKDLGYPGGDQDSYGAALGGIHLFQYAQGGSISARSLDISDATRLAMEHNSLLIYTGAAHVSASIHEDIKTSYAKDNSPTLRAMMVLREQALSMADSLENGDLTGYAAALSESCRQLYNLHESCDCAEHRRYFNVLGEFIQGGKTCGAGGGGFMLVFTKPGRRRDCIRKAEELGGLVLPVTIDRTGVTSWSEPPMDSAQIERWRQLVLSSRASR